MTNATRPEDHELRPMPLTMTLTIAFSIGIIFALGYLTGRIVTPVPGMLGGVPLLAWMPPAMIVLGALPSLLICNKARRSPVASTERPESATHPSATRTVQSPLELFPSEKPVSP